jgi:2-keto-4-pentenoate hydratase/2-oxohepta-3-ene-1,7-dioic acid hydratase in catechol pathway
MKLATFDGPAGRHVGVVEHDEIVDLTAVDPSLATMIDLLERGPQATVSGYATSAPRLPLSSVKLAAPVPRPPKFLAIGFNNPQHLEETNGSLEIVAHPARVTSLRHPNSLPQNSVHSSDDTPPRAGGRSPRSYGRVCIWVQPRQSPRQSVTLLAGACR